ncbi:MAG: hypothetical protein WC716_02285 [Chitinophagaceae bacterium]|jgi:hypothetical protein
MIKITYLLGAGASFNALPIVSAIPDEILVVLERLNPYKISAERDYGQNMRNDEFLQNLNDIDIVIQDLRFLLDGCRRHRSMDTFAHSFFLNKEEDEYRRVKNCIILFFELYSFFFPDKIDKRYDAFLNKVLNRDSPKFPKNINVLSWNYDYEFEKAFEKYSSKEIANCYDEINTTHKYSRKNPSEFDYCNFIKLNGTVGYFDDENKISLGLGLTGIKGHGNVITTLEFIRLVKNYMSRKDNLKPAISFSWEQPDELLSEKIENIMYFTDILIIIGYSFPDFNRKLDKMILASRNSKLHKIIIQDKDFNSVKSEIIMYRHDFEWENTSISEYANLDRFLIPHEFDV